MKQPIFKASHIVKQFGPTIALNDVDIEIYAGEIRGFIGENGSGKSTMSALMTGIHQKTSGTMWYHGEVWEPGSMIEALNGGLGIIVQENGTISEISVAENIFLGELKQFAGVNYFESRKIEDFSPLFDLDVSSIESIKSEYAEKISAASGEEAKKLLKQAEKLLTEEYKKLNDKLVKSNPEKKERVIVDFNSFAEKAFADFNAQIESINKKYEANADELDEVIRKRRLDNDINEAKRSYKRKVKGMQTQTYMKLDWIKKDVQSLKNCYINNTNDLKAINENKTLKKIKEAILNAVFGLFVNGKKLRKHAGYALSKKR
jgi:ABC-type branched-subunit amino acid transport system ATPase component